MTGGGRPVGRRTWPLILALTVLCLALDQGAKAWAVRALHPGESHELLGRFLTLDIIGNSGAAFSIGAGQTWVLTLVAVVIGVLVVWQARRIRSVAWAVAGGLVLGGLLGNLHDRLWRPPSFGRGHVVDFLDYDGFFIGNVADIFIVSAAVLVAILSFVGVSYDGSREQREGQARPGHGDDPAGAPAQDAEAPGDDARPGGTGSRRQGATRG